MMLLIGMKINFTKKPMNPMIAKPKEVAIAILVNSAATRSGRGAGQAVTKHGESGCGRAHAAPARVRER